MNHTGLNRGWDNIIDSSSKIVSFKDVGGHQKYSKSPVRAFMLNMPDYTLLVINPINGISPASIEHFRLSTAKQIPTFIVLTHQDKLSEEKIEETLTTVA